MEGCIMKKILFFWVASLIVLTAAGVEKNIYTHDPVTEVKVSEVVRTAEDGTTVREITKITVITEVTEETLVPEQEEAVAKVRETKKIAIARPVVRGRALRVEDVDGLADVLESRIGGDYEVITRTALQQIAEEANLQYNSGLVDTDGVLIEPARLSGVKYLLTSTISKLGSNLVLTMTVVDAETGKIDPKQRISITQRNLDGLLSKLDSGLEKMGIAIPKDWSDAVFAVMNFKIGGESGEYWSDLAAREFETALTNVGYLVAERRELQKIAAESDLAWSELAEPDQFGKIGELKVADYLVSGSIDRLDVVQYTDSNELTGGVASTRLTGYLTLHVKVVRVRDGVVIYSTTIEDSLRDRDIPVSERKDWTAADYQEALLLRGVNQAIKTFCGQ